MRPRDLAAYLFLALTWGCSFLVLVRVMQAFGLAGTVSLRCFLAAGTLAALGRVLGRRPDFADGWRPLAVVGATTVAGQLVGLSYATPIIGTAMAAILVATIPLFSMLLSRLWGLETLSRSALVGLGLGIGGIVALVGFPAVPITPLFLVGCAGSLASAACAAYGSVYASLHLQRTASWDVTTGAFLVGGLITLPMFLVSPLPGWPTLVDMLFLCLLAGGMSATTYVVYFRLVGAIGATRAISVEFAVTVVAVAIGALLLGEPLSLPQLAGGVVIILGCALVLGLIKLPGRG